MLAYHLLHAYGLSLIVKQYLYSLHSDLYMHTLEVATNINKVTIVS